MKDSIANTLRCAPSARIAEVRSGESVLRWPVIRRGPTSYAGTALRVVPPPPASGGSVEGGSVTGSARWEPASRPGVPAYPGRAVCPWLQTS